MTTRRSWASALALVGLVAVGATACSSASAEQDPEAKPNTQQQEIALLFAPTATGGTMKPVEGSSSFELTLTGVAPQVVWFADRPARQSGHIAIVEFVDAWEGYGFVADPPNAALAVLGADDSQDTVVVELGSPRLDEADNTVRFPVELLEEATGNLAHLAADVDPSVTTSFGPASLFIDDATGQEINGCIIHTLMRCEGTDFRGADLSGTPMGYSDLMNADLSNANLSNASLKHSNLSEANLSNANLSNVDLDNSQLFKVNLSGANLRGADLSKANLLEADLSDADTTGARFCGTTMPDGTVRSDGC